MNKPYIHFLLEDFDNIPESFKVVRSYLIRDADSIKLINNIILTTPLTAYISSITDTPIRSYFNINSNLDILELDRSLKTLSKYVMNITTLSDVMNNHYNPIWRVAAFIINFIIRLDNIYKQK